MAERAVLRRSKSACVLVTSEAKFQTRYHLGVNSVKSQKYVFMIADQAKCSASDVLAV